MAAPTSAMTPPRSDLVRVAHNLAKLPDHKHPFKNGKGAAGVGPSLRPHVKAIFRDPSLRKVAMGRGGDGGAGPPGATGGDAVGEWVGVSPSLRRRMPQVRHNILGTTPVSLPASASGALTLVEAKPQTPFKPNRFVVPDFVTTIADGLVRDMQVGVRAQYGAPGLEPFALFAPKATSGIWDMDTCMVGQKISFNATCTVTQTFYSCFVGEAIDGKPYPIQKGPLRRIGLGQTTLTASATANITVTSAVPFKGRKLVLDDTQVGSLLINSWVIGIQNQFMSADPVPAAVFSDLGQDIWLDLDEAEIGQQIVFNVTNVGTQSANFQGALLGEVDPAAIVKYGSRVPAGL